MSKWRLGLQSLSKRARILSYYKPFVWMTRTPLPSTRMLMARRTRSLALTITTLVLTILLVFNFPNNTRHTHKSRSSWPGYSTCSVERGVYINGGITCDNKNKRKFLSYQPPGGGWNNQRIAFENAVVMAKLLKRTLVVHPLAPHAEILRLKHLFTHYEGYEIYNSIKTENLLPLSKVIDLRHLSRLLPVKEIITDHQTFLQTFHKLQFYKVCHNSRLGLWVDAYPPENNVTSWNILRNYKENSRPKLSDIPLYKRICRAELNRYESDVSLGERPIWGILNELSNRKEDVIYFEEGSLFVREIVFFNKQRALAAHEWIMRFIRSAPELFERVQLVSRKIGYPFNAIHVRRADHPSRLLVSQDTWLTLLKKRGALNITNKLYVATDEKNKTWFEPFDKAGYNLLFAEDLASILQTHQMKRAVAQDVLGLYEQLICAHAYHFVGSYYSTFTLFIHRLRRQAKWTGGLIKKSWSTITWAGDL